MVFFERIGIEFQYEPEAFRLPDGRGYWPDFYLPHIRVFAEVKGIEPTPEEESKARLLVHDRGGLLLFLPGPPNYCSYRGVSWDTGDITECRYSLDIHATRFYVTENRLFSDPPRIYESSCSQQYRKAIWASRAERFDVSFYPPIGQEPFNPDGME